jgi:hypothetical protein
LGEVLQNGTDIRPRPFLVALRASVFNLSLETKNIILRRVSIFEFLHSQGQKQTQRKAPDAAGALLVAET